jgi:hypothetical protein
MKHHRPWWMRKLGLRRSTLRRALLISGGVIAFQIILWQMYR